MPKFLETHEQARDQAIAAITAYAFNLDSKNQLSLRAVKDFMPAPIRGMIGWFAIHHNPDHGYKDNKDNSPLDQCRIILEFLHATQPNTDFDYVYNFWAIHVLTNLENGFNKFMRPQAGSLHEFFIRCAQHRPPHGIPLGALAIEHDWKVISEGSPRLDTIGYKVLLQLQNGKTNPNNDGTNGKTIIPSLINAHVGHETMKRNMNLQMSFWLPYINVILNDYRARLLKLLNETTH
jgi:hypothetical protein